MTTEVLTAAAVAEELKRFVATDMLAKGTAFDIDTPLAALGIDSAALLSLLLFVERRFGVMVPDEQLTRANLATLSSLAGCVSRLAATGG